ncbi:flagellar hook-associated protein FlgK [bacterium]|nr:flagellar hook-associated protein FlgK [bacterium]
MSTLFFGLNVGKNALAAQTYVLNTISHNVANANTPGYSRQEVQLVSAESDLSSSRFGGGIKLGAGVDATTVTRSRFALYDEIYRYENQDFNAFSKTEDLAHQVELLFDEPSDRGFGEIINEFFNAWQDLANSPLNMAARQSLKSIGDELTSRMQRINNQLIIMQQDIDTEITTIPKQINEIASEVAKLNASIRIAGAQGGEANDLRDKRDTLIDELSNLVEVRTVEQQDGTMTVLVGSNVMVERDSSTELTPVSQSGGDRNIKKTGIISTEGDEFIPERGKLGALMNFRDEVIPGIITRLDKLAESLVTRLNFEHRNGYGLDGETNRDFFDPLKTQAFNISLSADIDDVGHIAVSGDGTKGDNSNARNIDIMKNTKIVDQTFTLSEYYNSLIADIGIIGQESYNGRVNQELLVNQIDSARERVKGVSIDEELIKMIQTQHIYQGASRLITTMDELLDTVVNMKR